MYKLFFFYQLRKSRIELLFINWKCVPFLPVLHAYSLKIDHDMCLILDDICIENLLLAKEELWENSITENKQIIIDSIVHFRCLPTSHC